MKGVQLTYTRWPAILLVLAALACNFPGRALSDEDIAATQTVHALETMVVETALAGEKPDQPAQSPSPEKRFTPTLAHEMQPSEPGILASRMTDLSSAPLADEHRAIGDSFLINLFERPFTAEVMDYQPHLDIVFAELGVNNPWVFAVIRLEGAPPEDAIASYAVEIDLDLDGRGDFLISAELPPSSEWTTDGVRVLSDEDDDIGSLNPLRPDAPNPERNGYEDLIFEGGSGLDPDAAWVRRDPEHENHIQFAFKYSLIDSDVDFLWGAWSDAEVKRPDWFDYHDHFTLEQAGDPASTSKDYPIKALAALDNTCRWAYGYTPTGNEPGLCGSTTVPTPAPGLGGYLVCTGGLTAAPKCECKPKCASGDQPCTQCQLP